ncbi:MAG: PAS domain S-box protein [Limisphaerales bacterium]
MKRHAEMTRAELIQCIKVLEQRLPTMHGAFEDERLLRELQVQKAELQAQNCELREAQQNIEVTRDRYADLYDFAPVSFVTLDDKGVIREINLTAAMMLGVQRTRLVGVPFHQHVLREDLAVFRRHLARLSSPGAVSETELRLTRKGDGPFPAVMRSELVCDGKKEGFMCRSALLDISVRKQAERELHDSETLLRAILDTAVNAIITIDEQGVIESFNHAAEKLFGYTGLEAIGQNVSLLMPSPHREQHHRHLANYRATGKSTVIGSGREVSCRRKDGSTFPADLSVSEARLARRRVFTGIVRDITKRKRVEESLIEANQFSKQVIDGAQAGIVVYDREGRFVVWNPFMEQISGYRAEEVLGRRTLELFPFLREQHIEEMFARALAGEIFEGPDTPYKVPERGREGWKVERFAPMRDAHGEIVGVIVAVRDITERRRLESELVEISDRERQRIGHDLHDGLGQRLTGLEMKCFLLLEDLAADDLAAEREKLREQARQMGEALRECVTATRTLAHGLSPMNVKADGLMEALGQLAHSTHLPGKVECRLICRTPVVFEGAQTVIHLYRIAQEAVNNALKHSRPRHIHIRLAHKEGMLLLQIKNDGRGLPGNWKSRSGIGLEIMRHRAHVIGASLEIDSKPGHGVSVVCTLPMRNP